MYAQWTYTPGKENTVFFDPILEQDGMKLWAAIYDTSGKMIAVTQASVEAGYPQATFKETVLAKASIAKLFQIDQNCRPLAEVQVQPL